MNDLINISKQYKTRIGKDRVFLCDFVRKYNGIIDDDIRFIEKIQLKDKKLWAKLGSFFCTDIDDKDNGWRSEYWGKIMRGATWVYLYTKDEELYDILTDTVCDLLSRQDEMGRFSTYSIENEFNGWDMWGRKYIMLGFLHYYDICRDNEIKENIVNALKRHADYIINHIGEGKKSILDTSDFWGCINSASILEPMVRLYNITDEKKYLDFSGYIISTGCCKEFNLIDAALDDTIYPYQYPVNKAYEMMSCFEGLLEYWRIKDDEKYIRSATSFVNKVIESDISIIGCAGCYGEQFDNAKLTQSDTEYLGIMQETCVTVTWMKLLMQIYCITGDIKYIEEFEKSAYNAMPGSVNNKMASTKWATFPFDSYSPLILGKRGAGVGGYKTVGDFNYGCCAAIGSAGLGLIPMATLMQTEKGFVCNMYIDGTVNAKYNGTEVRITTLCDIKSIGKIKILVECDTPTEFELKLRIPYYAKDASVSVNGSGTAVCEESFYTIKKVFDRDKIEISYAPYVEIVKPLSDKHKYIAFKYGPYVLARDLRFCPDTGKKITLKSEKITAQIADTDCKEYEFKIAIKDEDEIVTQMIDYASAGKTLSEESLMEAWIPLN